MTHYYQEYIFLLLCISVAEENPIIMMHHYVFLSIHSYGSTLNEDNFREATVSCRPENTFAIESADATLILGRRGNSHIPLDSELLSIDNKLQLLFEVFYTSCRCVISHVILCDEKISTK